MIRMPRRWMAALAAVALASCGGGDGGTPGTGPGPGPTVQTINLTAGFAFAPENVTVARGTTVRWVNNTGMAHTVTPDTPGQAGAWTGTTLQNGQTLEVTMNTAGTFLYHCIPHSQGRNGMVGTLTVQ